MPHVRRRIALPLIALGAGLAVSAGSAVAATPPAATPTSTSTSTTTAPTSSTAPGGSAPASVQLAKVRIRARVLRPGASGSDVSSLQQLLNAVGFKVDVTGNYLSNTSRVVQQFQFVAGLDPSGTAGPQTITALRAAASGPRSGGAAGGIGYGLKPDESAKLGQRIPLSTGMSGRDVKQLQDYLRRAKVKGARLPDGEFGKLTLLATKRWEAATGRLVDGIVDAGDMYQLLTKVGGEAAPGDTGDPLQDLPPAPLAPGEKATIGEDGLAIAPESAPDAVKQIIAAGNLIAFKPYRYGGGHAKWNDSGYDCSGSVSYALRGANLLKSPLASYDFFDWGDAGPGQWVTLYTNSGHMYMVVAGLRFDTSGRGADGSRWQTAMRDAGAFKVRHPAGL